MNIASTPFRVFLIRPWHATETKIHPHLDDGVEHVAGVIAAIQDAAVSYNALTPANTVEIVFDEDTMRPGATILEQLYVALQGCDLSVVMLDGLRPNVVFEYGMILGMLRAKGEPTSRVIAIHATDATVLVRNYYPEATMVPSFDGGVTRILNPVLDVGRHLSDIAGLFVYRYDRRQPIKTVRQWFLNYFSKVLVSLGPPRGTVSTDDATEETGTNGEDTGGQHEQQESDVWKLYKDGNYDAIINSVSRSGRPRDLQALALAYMKRSRIHDAMRAWMQLQTSISQQKDEPKSDLENLEYSVTLHLGICYHILGQREDAVEYLERAKKLAVSGRPENKVNSWLNRARREPGLSETSDTGSSA